MSGDIIIDVGQEWPGRGQIWDAVLRFHRVNDSPVTDGWARETPRRYLTTEPGVSTHDEA